MLRVLGLLWDRNCATAGGNKLVPLLLALLATELFSTISGMVRGCPAARVGHGDSRLCKSRARTAGKVRGY